MKKNVWKTLLTAIIALPLVLVGMFMIGLTVMKGTDAEGIAELTNKTTGVANVSILVQSLLVCGIWALWELLISARGKNAAHRQYLQALRHPVCGVALAVLVIQVI